MKKKLLSLLLVTSLFTLTVTGCGNTTDTEAETEEPAVEETENEESGEEIASEFFYTLQAHGLDNALLRVTTVDDAGETFVEETGSQGWVGGAGGTLAQTMEEWGIQSIEPFCDEFDFLGWSLYTIEDPDSSEEVPLYDGKIFTTDEILALELPACDVYFYTEWDFTCSDCEEKKVCEVYYIDDDRYIICDDCYEEFATAMDLLSDGEYLGNYTCECTGCEVEKDCGIYWVGGQEYYVCDDCYEEFATDMGLN